MRVIYKGNIYKCNIYQVFGVCHIQKRQRKRKHKRKEKAAKRESLREKEDIQERELCEQKKIERREQSIATFKRIISVCKGKENNEIFFSRETYTRGFIIVFGGLKLGMNLIIL